LRWDDSDITVYPSLLEGIILFFDLTRRKTFLNIRTKWFAWIDRTKQEYDVDRLRKDVVVVLVGNKADLVEKREVDAETIEV
jgi:GTPase SAR1 family protein